ncbi:MAG: response regulator transcription factor [Eubacteriales bacterium]|nr:response regulator transcription factor [Eubacteriales bacterium]
MKEINTILIVEDDTDINNLIAAILKRQGYEVIQSFSGTEAVLRLELETFQLVILDLMLPGINGETLLKNIREKMKNEIPVLVLSAKASLADKVQLLTSGADDYMTKPFEPEELAARVYSCLRRSRKAAVSEPAKECLQFKHLLLFPDSRRVTVKEQELTLTPYEYEILSLLVQSPEKVFSRESLYEQVWKGGYYGEDNTVNVHVSNLRKKIAAADPDEDYIKTIWGIGFKMA